MNVKKKILNDLTVALERSGFDKALAEIAYPPDDRLGDYSTAVALKLKRAVDNQSPMEIAKVIEANWPKSTYISSTKIESPGFINISLSNDFLQESIRKIVEEGEKYGTSEVGKGKKARVEFISANPTGPLHIGNARGGPIGDTLANVLESSGFDTLREYLNNDCGNQVLELGRTLATKAGFIEEKMADLVYQGDYINDLAKAVKVRVGDVKGLSKEEIIKKSGEIGVKTLFEEIVKDIKEIGIEYNKVYHESDLQKKLPGVLRDLESKKLLKKQEGAIWFAPRNEFLKDKDAVVIKSDGSYTYFGSDIVYHQEKFESGYDLIIDVFGSNTAGHVPKLKALVSSLGFNLERFKVILYQFVRVKRGKDVVKMSKRAGNFVTAIEVLDEVGKDAFRFFMLMNQPSTHMDFDLEQAKNKSADNPVYYVQYAHARAGSILRKAQIDFSNANLKLIKEKPELRLIRKIIKLPELVEDISQNFAVHLLASYSIEVADLFHKFYEEIQVVSEDVELTKARLSLVSAIKITLANSLRLMGVSSPETMEKSGV